MEVEKDLWDNGSSWLMWYSQKYSWILFLSFFYATTITSWWYFHFGKDFQWGKLKGLNTTDCHQFLFWSGSMSTCRAGWAVKVTGCCALAVASLPLKTSGTLPLCCVLRCDFALGSCRWDKIQHFSLERGKKKSPIIRCSKLRGLWS